MIKLSAIIHKTKGDLSEHFEGMCGCRQDTVYEIFTHIDVREKKSAVVIWAG